MPPGARLIFSRVTGALLFAGGLLLLSSAAQAQLVRYVASTGNDANPCTSPAAPCRTLQRGINSAPSGGEVKLLTSVDGNATIDRSLTISGNGATVSGSIVVNNASATVVLRNLHLFGTGHNVGIEVTAAASVHIMRCTVERFAEHAIVSGGPAVQLFVTDTVVRDNGGPGITVHEAGAEIGDIGSMTLNVHKSRIENNGADGLLLLGVGGASISQSVISGNHANGINLTFGAAVIVSTTASQNRAAGYAFVHARVVMDSSIARGNQTGMYSASDDPDAVISNSTFNNNDYGIGAYDPLRTRGNNTVAGNTIEDLSGTLIPLPGM